MCNLHADTLSVRATDALCKFLSIFAFVQVLMDTYESAFNSKFTSTVHEAAMLGVGDLALVLGQRFVQYLERADPMVYVGLNEGHKLPTLCVSAILLLNSIAQACSRIQFSIFLDEN